ncbi:AzlD domain-containing protein [Roseomonas populi]|uniref:AzlD domain-containing protein n=1 Tax=Roseomonas populi TaxID=3121582 RepID=A0ABT1X707_9PROT|nr:AzlD domain-containing protein [Roseomonas pecuniae]MCR0983892.1 AzlD domain-containing protein [Roseomonas pecuniae]
MGDGWGPLLAAILLMLALRGIGVALAWRLPADHPAIAWATAVSEAALSAWVVLALVSPGPWPLAARLAGAGVALAVFILAGRRLLPGLALGLAAVWVVDWLLR